MQEIENCMIKWQAEFAEEKGMTASGTLKNRPKPWKRNDNFQSSDVTGKMHIVLGDGIYVDALNLMPRLQNQIRSLAAFDNPVFYKNKRLGYSNYYHLKAVYMGKDTDGYIRIPRGLREKLTDQCKNAGIIYEIEDHREKGRPVRVTFNGDLRTQQELAAHRLLTYDHGILNAATAFGKTVVCSYLIAERKVNTLILLQSKDLLEQWVDELNKFLVIDEEPPAYQTKGERIRKRDSVIGILHGSKDTLTGIVDVAMVGSIYRKGNFHERLNTYGQVIMDECHHAASSTAIQVLQKVNARYVYGVSATPRRGDSLEKIIYMLLGPIRHSYTAKERAAIQGIGHFVYPRYTRMVDTKESRNDINGAFSLISTSVVRNEMILGDTRECIQKKRAPVLLTKYKEHAKYLYDHLQGCADHVFLLYGDNTDKENSEIRRQMKEISDDESMILVATGQKIGEGFDLPRLDTLMLASPVSFSGRLEQYVGRLNRDYKGKAEVIVYDYVDSHIGCFDRMFAKRLRTYKRTGFQLVTDDSVPKQTANAIYDSGNYSDVFERDVIEARKRIIVSSPGLTYDKTERFLYLLKPGQETGVEVTVITTEPESLAYGSAEFCQSMIENMRNEGVHVILKEAVEEHFAIIDDDLVWHGGMNLLGREDAWDNLMRIQSSQVAAELLEIALGDRTGIRLV